MRRIKFSLSVLFLLLPLCLTAQVKLTILHTNDTHSCIYPLNSNLADTLYAGRGGFLRRLAMLREERAKDPELLLFDSGDFSQGSPYYTLFKGEVEAELMRRMHYDVGAVGNHEFDYGLENMAKVFRTLGFPVVCANYDFMGTPCEGVVKPYVILRRKGVRIGVFGISPELDGLVQKEKCQGVKYLDPVATARKWAVYLKEKKKCDLVVCISHLGWLGKEKADQLMISQTRDIDLVLGGHSHTFFRTLRYENNLDGKPVADDQNGKSGIFVGKLVLTLAKK